MRAKLVWHLEPDWNWNWVEGVEGEWEWEWEWGVTDWQELWGDQKMEGESQQGVREDWHGLGSGWGVRGWA